jgi:hypothetical protein
MKTLKGRFFVLAVCVGLVGALGGCSNDFYSRAEVDGMMPIAKGLVAASGTITSSTGNFTVAHTGTGVYSISINGISFSSTNHYVLASIAQNVPAMISWFDFTGTLRICTFNSTGTPADYLFSFEVWGY